MPRFGFTTVIGLAVRRVAGGPGAAAAVDERRVHDDAAQALLAYRERQLAVIAVEEAVPLVEAAGRRQRPTTQRQAHAVHRRHLDDVAAKIHRALERVD